MLLLGSVELLGDMRKGVAKFDASALVSLCKERKEFIKAAKYCRFDLVSSFVLYLESLLELGNALNKYVEQELVILDDCCAQISLSDFDPCEENFHLGFPSSDSDSDLHSLFNHSQSEEEEPRGLNDTPEVHDKWHTCKHHSAAYVKNRGKTRDKSSNQEWSHLSYNNPHRGNQDNTHIHVDMSCDDLGQHLHSQPMSFGKRWETAKGDHWFPQHMNHNSFEGPMSFPYNNDWYAHHGTEVFPIAVSPSYDEVSQKHGIEQNNPTTVLSTPPPPQVSTWDFLYPFSMNYDVPYDHDCDVREIREREGIPDLEDESEQGLTVSDFNQKEIGSGIRHDSGSGNVPQLNANEDVLSTKCKELEVRGKTAEKEIKCSLESKAPEVIWSEAVETTSESCESLGVCIGRMSLKEAILDIRNEFKYLFDSGKEFSSVIEVGKLPHLSKSFKLKGLPSSRARLLSNADMRNNQEHVCCDLSSTLEKLYVWEKKLYQEVMGEEKLRIPYDKKYKRLKELDSRGSESDRIDETLASIKLLHSEINVSVASISSISREINELRDNKLLPEVNKLIEGLM
ncbi:uncharacterized protein LOC113869121 [Abrus precatorius]|uniref:Uncharacterized protein LOC113869121 n=1 Tax=Abrus precatorius TaxID=3816 RepID=A0A8B8LXU2_ABRPR|nr:uncharacterized protein LOC113869121 [Abrus precatorius]